MVYPDYSVLMSVYYKENPEWFENAISCMLNQTVFPSEFVLVEDGPLTTELYKVIENYNKQYPTLFKIIKLDSNQGLGLALKEGILNCSYEYIARMDSDDDCDQNRIKRELDIFEMKPEIGIVGTNVVEFIDSPQFPICKVVLPEHEDEIRNFIKKRNPFRHPSILFRKSAVLKAGNYRNYPYFEDYDLWVRMVLQNNVDCYNIQDELTYMRINEDFYKRRGGIKYLGCIYQFKKELYQSGYISRYEFFKTFFPHMVVCLLPNVLRELVYKLFLRK